MRYAKLVCVFALVTSTACVPIPIPHKVTLTPKITGSVVAEETGLPVCGARIRVVGTDLETQSGIAGDFTIPESTGWYYCWVIPLLFMDLAQCDSGLIVTLPGATTTDPESLACKFFYEPPTPYLLDTGQYNRDNPVDVGKVAVRTGRR